WGNRLPALPADRDDDDGGGRVMRHLAAYRAHPEMGEPPAATGAEDHQVGVVRGVDHLLGRYTADRAHGHRCGSRRADRIDHLLGDLFRRLAHLVRFSLVRRVDLLAARPRVARYLLDGKHGQGGVPEPRLLDRPFKYLPRVFRAINADNDSRHGLL